MKIILITLIFSFVVAEACVCPVSYDEYTNAVIKNLQEQQESLKSLIGNVDKHTEIIKEQITNLNKENAILKENLKLQKHLIFLLKQKSNLI